MDFESLYRTIGYEFNNKDLLVLALTHSSAGSKNYERLEFLGDAVLELYISERIYKSKEYMDEGTLTKYRAKIVCEESLSEFAKMLGLGQYIVFGKSEMHSGGMYKPSILCDVAESVLGAIYLDGGESPARIYTNRIADFAEELIKNGELESDYKTALQELMQERKNNPSILYKESGKTGKDNDPVFKTKLYIDGDFVSEGSGRSKKLSEQSAAKAALKILH